MTLQELKEAQQAERKRFNTNMFNLKLKFAKENTSFSIGDIVEDQSGIHLLESIKTYDDWNMDAPKLVFNSKQLRKSDLQEMKKPKCFEVFEKNIKRLIFK